MAPLKVGDKFPSGVTFDWAPIVDEDPSACGLPQTYDASKEFAGKKVVLVSVPGAFTPTCSANHVPPYIKEIEKFQSKGVDQVVVIASNDAFVMNAWGKVNKAPKGEKILFMSDTKSGLAKSIGWQIPGTDRNDRWALVVEKDGTISYIEKESDFKQVTVSGADAILGKL